MSIIVTAEFNGQEFEVEITRDLSMIFLDYNLTHDLAALEFGYPETNATKLAEAWESEPMKVVNDNLVIPTMMRLVAACDWTAHVLPIFEERAPKRVQNKLEMVVTAVRRHLLAAIDSGAKPQGGLGLWGDNRTMDKLRQAAMSAKRSLDGYFGYAAELVAQCAVFLAAAYDTSRDISWNAAAAFSWYDSDSRVFPDALLRNARREEESAWQVRRLVDVIEALEAGRPLPPLEATP